MSPVFTLTRFNKRRYNRGVAAAEVEVAYTRTDRSLLWMTNRDLCRNVALYGQSEGLAQALAAYREAAQ